MNRLASEHTSTPSLPPDVRWMNSLSHLLVGMLLAGVAAWALLWVSRQPFFALRGIVVEGDTAHGNVSAIRTNVVSHLVGNFFSIDLQAAQAAFETVPWVRQAALKRVWPNRLEVRLQEHRVAALWVQDIAADAQPDRLVNTYGEVFEANLGDVEDEALPVLAGPQGSARHMLVMLQRLSETLAPLKSDIDKLTLSSRGSWQAVLDNDVRLELGRGSDDDVMARTAQFIATLGHVMERFERPLVYADLRHRDGYVVRLKGVTTPQMLDDKPNATTQAGKRAHKT